MTIGEFFRTLWSGRFYVVGAVVVVVVAALLVGQQQETVHRATAQVQLASVQAAIGGGELEEITVPVDTADLRSEPVTTAVAQELDHPGDPQDLASRVSGERGDATVYVSVESPDVTEAVDMANAFAVAYADLLGEQRTAQARYYEERRAALADQLSTIEPRLDGTQGDPLAAAERDLIVSEYTTLTMELGTLESLPDPVAVASATSGAEELGTSMTMTLAVALLAGLVAGVGLAFARRGLDVRVRRSADAAQLADSPVLAEITSVRAAAREFRTERVLPVSLRAATPFTESIRELRTAIEVAVAQVEHPVIVVTAADRYRSRSFVTANLAASFALSGLRTVVVNGDLRQPELERLFPLEADSGLQETAIPGLLLQRLPETQMDPADYLATTRVRDLLEELRLQSDIIVIDAPPVLAAADAAILGRYATGVVVLAAVGQTDRSVLTRAADRLRTTSAPLIGVALTEVKVDRKVGYAGYGEEKPTTPPPADDGARRRSSGRRVRTDEDAEPAMSPHRHS